MAIHCLDDFHSALEQNVLQEFNNVHFTSKNLTQKPMCKETAFESWKSKQEIVYGSLVDSYTANQNLCGLCKAISGYGIIKCKDCCNYLCFSCDRKRHSYDPSHQRMYFKTDSSFKSLLPTEFITSRGEVVEQRNCYLFIFILRWLKFIFRLQGFMCRFFLPRFAPNVIAGKQVASSQAQNHAT